MNPAKEGGFPATRIHMGLTLLGQILADSGCRVKVVDYSFLSSLRGELKVPQVEEVIRDFEPDVIGISIFTYLCDESQSMIERVSRCCSAPVIVGGPHVTLFPEDFASDERVSYVVRGEAEAAILGIVRHAKRESLPVIIDCFVPPAEHIPAVNLDIAVGSEYLKEYQIQLSRGCPFNCSFCSVDMIAGRRVRARDLNQCMDQIAAAIQRCSAIESVAITDDCPTFNRARFKEFLRKFAEKGLDVLLTVDNMRADLIDEEMLQLYSLAGGQNICLGLESGHPEVFKLVHKGESLSTIIEAAKLVRKFGIQLGLCFVIGLPEDTFERHKSSVALAKRLRPDYIYWNMCNPWPGTDVHEWFKKNGEIGNIRNFSTLISPKFTFSDPPAVSYLFPKEERIKAWLTANLETHNLHIFRIGNLLNLPADLGRLLSLTKKYKLYRSFFIYIWEFIAHKLWSEIWKKLRLHFWRKRRQKTRKKLLAGSKAT